MLGNFGAEGMPAGPETFDFFVSRRGSAKEVAAEVVGVLRSAGYSAFIQDDGIDISQNFIAEMHARLTQCRHFIAIVTQDYFQSPFTLEEWSIFLAVSTQSKGTRRFIPIRVEALEMTGLFTARVYADR